MIKLCVFDMDGTIVDSLQDLAVAMNDSLAKHHLPTHQELEKFKYFVGDGVKVFAYRAIGEPLNQDEDFVKEVSADYQDYYGKHYDVYSKPYDGILEFLRYLNEQGCKIAVLTNKPTAFAKTICEKMFTGIEFEYIIGPSQEYPRKPDTKALKMMLDTLKVHPNECLYFGDTNTDMMTATKAGVIAVGVTWGFRSKEELIESGANIILDHPLDGIKLYQKY